MSPGVLSPLYPALETTRQARRRYQREGPRQPVYSDNRIDRMSILERREQQAKEREARRKALQQKRRRLEELQQRERQRQRQLIVEGKLPAEAAWGKTSASQPRLHTFFPSAAEALSPENPVDTAADHPISVPSSPLTIPETDMDSSPPFPDFPFVTDMKGQAALDPPLSFDTDQASGNYGLPLILTQDLSEDDSILHAINRPIAAVSDAPDNRPRLPYLGSGGDTEPRLASSDPFSLSSVADIDMLEVLGTFEAESGRDRSGDAQSLLSALDV